MRKLTFLLLGLLACSPLYAQTTLNSTTLSAAAPASASTIALTSVTSVTAGDIVFVDNEAMQITSTGTLVATNVAVSRGYGGTAARAHATGAVAYTGVDQRFYRTEVTDGSTCTAASELFLPHIVLPTGNVYQCTNTVWNQLGSTLGTVTASFVQGGIVANAVSGNFFVVDRPYVVTAIRDVWTTPESTGAMNVTVQKSSSTTACVASGTTLQTAAVDATATAETVTSPTLTATVANRILAAGDRLCVVLTATPNEVVGLVVTVTLAPR